MSLEEVALPPIFSTLCTVGMLWIGGYKFERLLVADTHFTHDEDPIILPVGIEMSLQKGIDWVSHPSD